MGARRARCFDRELVVSDESGQLGAILDSALPRTWKPDGNVVNTQGIGQFDETNLVADVGINNRRRLNAITQSFAKELDLLAR